MGLETLLQTQEGGQCSKLFANHGEKTKKFWQLHCNKLQCRVVMCQVNARLLPKKIFWEFFGFLK